MARWTEYDVEDFCDHYWEVIAPALQEDGLDPSEPPTHDWLVENGFTGYCQAVKYHLDKTFLQFCNQDLDIQRGNGHIYEIDVDHARTRELAYRWAERHRLGRKNLALATAKTDLQGIDRIAGALREVHGDDDLLHLGSDDVTEPEAFEVYLDAFDHLDAQYNERTMKVIHTALKLFYRYLKKRRNPVTFNPMLGLRDEYSWNELEVDPEGLPPETVNALARVAETVEEKTIVVLLCAAGLRRAEVARMHRDMINFDPEFVDTPLIEFDTRKNGPSTVNLVFGVDTLQERIEQLEDEYGDDWDGYLFPSPYRYKDHFAVSTIGKKLDELAERALEETDVDVHLEDGRLPTPQTARRFWYNQYSMGVDFLAEVARSIAGEQGSRDPQVVLTNYLSEHRRVEILRDHMAETLAEAFVGTDISPAAPDRNRPDVEAAVDEVTAGPDMDTVEDDDVEDVETPIDRFLQKNTENTTEDDSSGWLSELESDESGFFYSGTAMKGVAIGSVVTLATQLVPFF